MEILGLDMIKKEPDTINITGLDKIRQVFHNDLPKMSPFATELIRLVNRAKELDTEYRLSFFEELVLKLPHLKIAWYAIEKHREDAKKRATF